MDPCPLYDNMDFNRVTSHGGQQGSVGGGWETVRTHQLSMPLMRVETVLKLGFEFAVMYPNVMGWPAAEKSGFVELLVPAIFVKLVAVNDVFENVLHWSLNTESTDPA